jgi:hypothetical protein
MRFAFLIIIPGNAAAFACHSEKIFRRCSGRMNFLRITGGIDARPMPVRGRKRSKQ